MIGFTFITVENILKINSKHIVFIIGSVVLYSGKKMNERG